jgi:putative protein-disulfide isomerase
MTLPKLLYFADPMCSWCWGFTPVIDAVKKEFADRLNLAIVMGGLRPGSSEKMSSKMRDKIFHHWRSVDKMTGQDFTFEGAMPSGFIYDTEPPSRALISVANIDADITFAFFKALQSAFYTKQMDVTQTKILTQLANEFDIDSNQFLTEFESEQAKHKTHAQFEMSRQYGVRGFPTLILYDEDRYYPICNGYQSLEPLKSKINHFIPS